MSALSKASPRFAVLATALALTVVASGCAAIQDMSTAGRPMRTSFPTQDSRLDSTGQTQRLEKLWQQRTHDGFGAKFTLGPGDVLEISVPLEQLRHREVRVSSDDTIELPLAGVVSVRGMTERGLTAALQHRLSKYMYNPPVSLFVKRYGSREVAVVGAVEKPGLYTLISGSETLMDMVDKAGGLTRNAAARIVFVPGASGGGRLDKASFLTAMGASDGDGDARAPDGDTRRSADDPPDPAAGRVYRSGRIQSKKVGAIEPTAAVAPRARASVDPFGPAVAKLHPITISMADPAVQQYLGMPARPGDVLIVPSAGEVTVGGWVQSPGAYKISPGMTALSAISAAGGALFSSTAEILRTAADGQRLSIPVDISEVQAGREADVPVESGDVVMVDRSPVGAIPYALYEVFTKFGTGMYLPAP